MLDNPAAPGGAMLTQITGTLFKRWMTACGAIRTDSSNPGQIVAILIEDAWQEHEHSEGGGTPPNWHLTMMGNRDSTVSVNFHFKAEFGKACAHYWHYVLYRDAATAKWSWAGSPNLKIPATNQGGGGAGANHEQLKSNLTLVQMQLRQRSKLEKFMSNKKRDSLLATLNKWDAKGMIAADGNGVFDGGSAVG